MGCNAVSCCCSLKIATIIVSIFTIIMCAIVIAQDHKAYQNYALIIVALVTGIIALIGALCDCGFLVLIAGILEIILAIFYFVFAILILIEIIGGRSKGGEAWAFFIIMLCFGALSTWFAVIYIKFWQSK